MTEHLPTPFFLKASVLLPLLWSAPKMSSSGPETRGFLCAWHIFINCHRITYIWKCLRQMGKYIKGGVTGSGAVWLKSLLWQHPWALVYLIGSFSKVFTSSLLSTEKMQRTQCILYNSPSDFIPRSVECCLISVALSDRTNSNLNLPPFCGLRFVRTLIGKESYSWGKDLVPFVHRQIFKRRDGTCLSPVLPLVHFSGRGKEWMLNLRRSYHWGVVVLEWDWCLKSEQNSHSKKSCLCLLGFVMSILNAYVTLETKF